MAIASDGERLATARWIWIASSGEAPLPPCSFGISSAVPLRSRRMARPGLPGRSISASGIAASLASSEGKKGSKVSRSRFRKFMAPPHARTTAPPRFACRRGSAAAEAQDLLLRPRWRPANPQPRERRSARGEPADEPPEAAGADPASDLPRGLAGLGECLAGAAARVAQRVPDQAVAPLARRLVAALDERVEPLGQRVGGTEAGLGDAQQEALERLRPPAVPLLLAVPLPRLHTLEDDRGGQQGLGLARSGRLGRGRRVGALGVLLALVVHG